MVERNPSEPVENLLIGTIIEVDGPRVIAELDTRIVELSRVYAGAIYPIGQFGSIVKIHFGRKIIYGYVSRLRMKSEYERERGIEPASVATARVIEADLFGEGEWVHGESWQLKFERGVSTYPLPQQGLYLTPRSELSFVYGKGKGCTIELGEHVGSAGTPCHADLNELLGKHTAILGSTGAGKSGTVAAILHSIMEHGANAGHDVWHPRIVLLDPHNEYGDAFPGHMRMATDEEGSLCLPYWLLDMHETIGLLIGKTEFVATSQVNIVKRALLNARRAGAEKIGLNPEDITVDSPVPYELSVFRNDVDSQKPSQPSKQDSYLSILAKLDVLCNDARMNFMMRPWSGESDGFSSVVSQFMGDALGMKVDRSGWRGLGGRCCGRFRLLLRLKWFGHLRRPRKLGSWFLLDDRLQFSAPWGPGGG